MLVQLGNKYAEMLSDSLSLSLFILLTTLFVDVYSVCPKHGERGKGGGWGGGGD